MKARKKIRINTIRDCGGRKRRGGCTRVSTWEEMKTKIKVKL